MTHTQLTMVCRSIERRHIIEVAVHSGLRFCGIPERVRIDLTDGRVVGELVMQSVRGQPRSVRFVDIAAVRCLPWEGEA